MTGTRKRRPPVDVAAELLFRPGEFFRRRVLDEYDLSLAIVLVAASAAVSAIGLVGVVWSLSKGLPTIQWHDHPLDLELAARNRAFSHAFLAFFGTFVVWYVLTALLYVVALLLGGRSRSFVRTQVVVGLSFAVTIVISALGVGYGLLVFGPDSLSRDPLELFAQVRWFARVSQGGLVLAALAWPWQAYIWTGGLEHALGLDSRRAAVAAGVVALCGFAGTVLLFARPALPFA